MIPDDHEEVNMQEFDPEAHKRSRRLLEEDDDDHMAHGPGVSCATQ